jgi:RHS repeat-associated protein
MTGGTTATTHYIGSLFEKEIVGSATTYRHNIYAAGQTVAVYTRPSSGSNTLRYVHRDHQSNVVALTNDSGTISIQQAYSFDAFGKRRNTDWTADTGGTQFGASHLTERGYTGHEHLDNVRLIHMNGRVQDPVLGRFLSADPFVQAPFNGQSLNRTRMSGTIPSRWSIRAGIQVARRICAAATRSTCGGARSTTTTSRTLGITHWAYGIGHCRLHGMLRGRDMRRAVPKRHCLTVPWGVFSSRICWGTRSMSVNGMSEISETSLMRGP